MGSRSKQPAVGIVIDQQIRNLAGRGIKDVGKAKNKAGAHPAMVLRDVCTDALLRDEMRVDPATGRKIPVIMPGTEKVKHFRIAKKIYDASKRVGLTAPELIIVKDQIAKHFSKTITGRAWELLDPGEALAD